MKNCPHCRLPLRRLGKVFAARSADGSTHGVVGLCANCAAREAGLPRAVLGRRYAPSLERALQNPDQYQVALMPDSAVARLAVSLIDHREFTDRALEAIGWRAAGAGSLRGSDLFSWQAATGQ